MPNLWMQGITEAGEDREIRRLVARHMRAVHDHVGRPDARGAGRGRSSRADRDPDAEAWVMIAGGLLRSVADRLGGLLDDDDLAAIQRERMRWLLGGGTHRFPDRPPASGAAKRTPLARGL